jgi:lipid II:glycine glycyltransferase (peptidoglycan interpeptide bridge formation enzyme)
MYAVKTVGRLNTNIRVSMSCYPDNNDSSLWSALLDFAKKERATSIDIEVISSAAPEIPRLDNEISRQVASAYVLDFSKPNSISSNHRRNIQKAEKNNVRLIKQQLSDAVKSHLVVCEASGERRATRGENVAYLPEEENVRRLLEDPRSAAVYQAAIDKKVVSSMIVVFVGEYAFFDTAGSSPEGMGFGASHYLMSKVIDELRAADLKAFNLGLGTESRAGLGRYKAGFGANRYFVETVSVDTSSIGRRAILNLAARIRGSWR